MTELPTTELEVWGGPQLDQRTDSWMLVVESVAALSVKIANTELVPDQLRGKPAAVAAIILYGREIGLPPMTALHSAYLVKGKVGLHAETKRALVLAAGHEIEYREQTSTRCVAAGRRAGSETWHEVTWTSSDVRQAGLRGDQWDHYPRQMLKARATSELCNDIFSDVVGGFETVEELEDQDRPKVKTARISRLAPIPPTEPDGEGDAPDSGPDAETGSAPVEVDAGPTPVGPSQERYGEAEPDGPELLTSAQLKKLATVFSHVGVTERSDRLSLSSALISREITTASELTKDEASLLIDLLEAAERSENTGEVIDGYRGLAGLIVNVPMISDSGEPVV